MVTFVYKYTYSDLYVCKLSLHMVIFVYIKVVYADLFIICDIEKYLPLLNSENIYWVLSVIFLILAI